MAKTHSLLSVQPNCLFAVVWAWLLADSLESTRRAAGAHM